MNTWNTIGFIGSNVLNISIRGYVNLAGMVFCYRFSASSKNAKGFFADDSFTCAYNDSDPTVGTVVVRYDTTVGWQISINCTSSSPDYYLTVFY